MQHDHINVPKILSVDAFSRAQMRPAAGLRPAPLESLSAPPNPLATIGREVLLLRGREAREAERKGEVEGKRRGCPLFINSSSDVRVRLVCC